MALSFIYSQGEYEVKSIGFGDVYYEVGLD